MTPRDAQWLARGRAHQDAGRAVDAMLCYRRAVRADAQSGEAHLHLGEVLWQLGRLNEAIIAWRDAVRVDPKGLQSHLALAEGALATADFAQAAHVADAALKQFPRIAPLLLVLGVSRLATGGEPHVIADAVRLIVEAIETHPDLLNVASLAGPLAGALDRTAMDAPRAQLAHFIGSRLAGQQSAVATPALLLALALENGLQADVPAAHCEPLLRLAEHRAYGFTEHDALRRIALVAARLRHPTAAVLGERYASLCVQAFAPSTPLLWPHRTPGMKLRVAVLVAASDAQAVMHRLGEQLPVKIGERAEWSTLVMGDPVDFDRSALPFATRVVDLPKTIGLHEAKQLAVLDLDVLIDACGLQAATGPFLAARPARTVVALEGAGDGTVEGTLLASATPLVDETMALNAVAGRLASTIAMLDSELTARVPAADELASKYNDAVSRHQAGERAEALRGYGEVLSWQPSHAPTLHLRGVLHREMNDLEAALADFAAAVKIAPMFLDARIAAAQCALDLGRADLAVELAQSHLADVPGYKNLWRVLGLAHLARGEADIAAATLDHATRLDLTDGETHYNHGVALQTLRRYDDAARAYQRALAFRPDLSAADFNLGVLFQEQGQTDPAITAYTQVLRQDPTHSAAYKNLGEVLFAAGRLDAWRANFLRFESRCPDALPLAVQALEVCQHFGDFERLELYLDGLRSERFTTASPAELVQCLEELLYLLLFFDLEPDIMHRFYQTYDATARVVYGTPIARDSERSPGRVRVGYLSADLRNHVMGKMVWEALHRHDRAEFDICFYSLSATQDEWTARFRSLGSRFQVLAHSSDKEAARRIAEDDLDILVDLSTHTRGAKPGILALKPARVQITHVASAGAVGLSSIDFKLTDHFADTPANQQHMIEQLLAMEGCVYPYRHIAPSPTVVYERKRLGIDEDAFVIGAFVTPMKLSRRC
ncbi:MAG: tetratricopeptide repeat protein, partial [Pseudomonadota bacterium]|nr:tetratricopeptide repeat protein [Pseudomonadota bacterium]